MQIKSGTHLTYCTNIHSGETWEEVLMNLKKYLPEIKKNVSPNHPFGVGLRLSNSAAKQLLQGTAIDQLDSWLSSHDLYVFTLNGFPYGSFHGQRVKDQVHQPDWTTQERLNYTLDLFKILSRLLPDRMVGGISTSPLSYKPWFNGRDKKYAFEQATLHLCRVVEELYKMRAASGKTLHLDIEPEPDGLLENLADTERYFSDWLLPKGIRFLSDRMGLSASEAESTIKEHIQLCYDVCHFAVMYEDPHIVFKRLTQAGIKIGKIQISAALKAFLSERPQDRKEVQEAFASLNEPTYLHQVVERDVQNRLSQYRDLTEALTQIQKPEAREWRTHFHVPIFTSQYDALTSTRDEIEEVLNIIRDKPYTHHLEIETYTWEVLPESLKSDLSTSIQRELNWVLDWMHD